ncbi:MAG: hypothetical protein MR291_03250 [Oscillospiraceae bacterium]|nr:hypothetical protein [Oscillospiraceae bacterium]
MMWWNGDPLPIPSPEIRYEYRMIEGTNSGQTLGGYYSKKIIAKKEDLHVTWEGLSAEECAVIGRINNSTYGNLTYYSPAAGKYVTRTMHVESHSEDMTEADLDSGRLSGAFNVAVQFRER